MLWSTGGIGGEMIKGKEANDDEDDYDDIDIPLPKSQRKNEKKELK